MIVSEARILANRRNAARSTGPKTEAGKERSRANALKHGLCSSVVVEENQELIQERTLQWFEALNPQNHAHNWMIDKIAVLSIRIDRAERQERRVRDKVALKAALTWDEDRRLEVEILGTKLTEFPALTVQALKKTPQGCEWLLTRWAMLAYQADQSESWTEAQTHLAFDMLGTPQALRGDRKPGVSLDFDGFDRDSTTDLAAVARAEIARLKELREIVADVDETERALAETDLGSDSSPELRRLRRYETSLQRQLRWYIDQIKNPPPHKCPRRGLNANGFADLPVIDKPTEDEKLAAAHPAHAIHPPFCLEPSEYPEFGKDADIPAILRSRKETRLRKAEARRDAKRRKIEKLRA